MTEPTSTAPSPRVLLVGAGAVGVAYGYFLQKGGAHVSFLVRPKYAEALRAGTHVYRPKKRGERTPTVFAGYDVLSSDVEVEGRRFDQVWLCMSSTALRQPWLAPFIAAVDKGSPGSTVVLLQPGADDQDHLASHVDKARIVSGLITLIAYQTPLPGEAAHPPGIALYIPPLTKFPVRGDATRARAVAELVTRGGWKAKVLGPLGDKSGTPAGAILQSHIVALEGVGWRFAALFDSPLRKLACAAGREGMAITAAHLGKGAPFMRHFVRPWFMGVFLRLARWKMPFDFEVYLEYHFTKVRDQTIEALGSTIALGDQLGLPNDALSDLERQVFRTGPTTGPYARVKS